MLVHVRTKWLLALVIVCSVSMGAVAQSKLYHEQRIFVWDVSGSLLPKSASELDCNGKPIGHCDPNGNGLWRPLKENIIQSIQSIEEDGKSRIIIAPFLDKICEIKTFPATNTGKQEAIKYVQNYQYNGKGKATGIAPALDKAFEQIDNDYINLVFLYTDGTNQVGNLPNSLNKWQNVVDNNPWAFMFYVYVHNSAKTAEVMNAANNLDKFWIVDNAQQVIHLVGLPTAGVTYEIASNGACPIDTIHLIGNYTGAMGEIELSLVQNNEYSLLVEGKDLSKGWIAYRIVPQTDCTTDKALKLQLSLHNTDAYTFLLNNTTTLKILTHPARVWRLEQIRP